MFVLCLCCVVLCCIVLYCVASLVYLVRLKPIFSLWFLERNQHIRFLHLRFNFSWQLRFWSCVFICDDIALQAARCLRTQRMSRAPPATGLTRCTNFNAKQRVWLGSVMNIKTTSWDQQHFFFQLKKNCVLALLPPDPLLRLVSFGLFRSF